MDEPCALEWKVSVHSSVVFSLRSIVVMPLACESKAELGISTHLVVRLWLPQAKSKLGFGYFELHHPLMFDDRH